jgi:hypothetical protein
MRVKGGSHVVVGITAQIKTVNRQIDIDTLIDQENIEESQMRNEGGRIECFVEW